METFYPWNRNLLVHTVKDIQLNEAGNVTLYTPPDAELRVTPIAFVIDIVKAVGTLTTAPIIRIDDGTDGEDILGATTLTAPVTNKYFYAHATTPTNGQNFVITNGRSLRLRKATLGVGQATTFRARSGNIATITTSAAHGLVQGDQVVVASLGGTGYNGTVTVVRVPSTTTFQYTSVGADEASTADTAGRVGGVKVNVTVISL